MLPNRPPHRVAIPARVLLVLATAVTAAHVLVLETGGAAWGTGDDPHATRVFSTRTLVIRPEPPPAVAKTEPPAPPVRQPRPPPLRKAAGSGPSPFAAAPPAAPQIAPLPEPEPVAEPVAAELPPPVAAAQRDAEPAKTPAADPVAAPPEAPPALPREAALPARVYIVPASAQLDYSATGRRGSLDYHATAQLSWQHDGTRYNARLLVSAPLVSLLIGDRIFSSTGAITADGLAPRRYSDKWRSEHAAHFDRDNRRIVFSANTPSAELLPGAQDRVSLFVQLAAIVAGTPLDFPIGASITLPTVGTRDAQPFTFVVEKEEMLDLPSGLVPALKFVRRPQLQYDQTIELWLAPQIDYLPARIRITDANGNFVDQQWRAARATPVKAPAVPELPAAATVPDTLKTPLWPQSAR